MRESILIVTKEEDPLGHSSSKVSQIATMFQSGEEASFSFQQPKIREPPPGIETPGPATVVRTQSHVARFNTAKALFEKMAEKKDTPGRSGRISTLSMSSTENPPRFQSRSPSPAVPKAVVKTSKPSVATISSTTISPCVSPSPSPASPSSSSVFSMSPVPRSFTSSCRTLSASSSDSGEFPVPVKRITSLEGQKSSRQKPEKPVKPESLSHQKTSHQQRKELVQRHKNWFQSFSKSKSPVTSPVKSSRTLSPEGSESQEAVALGSFEEKTESKSQIKPNEKPISDHSSRNGREPYKRLNAGSPNNDRSNISYGRSPDLTDSSTKVKSSTTDISRFEDTSTLPSTWCPPKQYVSMTTSSSSPSKDHEVSPPDKPKPVTSVDSPSQDSSMAIDLHDDFVSARSQSDLTRPVRTKSEAVLLRRHINVGKKSGETTIHRHSFHREPDNFTKEQDVSRPLSSLEGDRERRLREWEKKKQEREKRHSEGNIYIPQYQITEKKTVMERIKSFETIDDQKDFRRAPIVRGVVGKSICQSDSKVDQQVSKTKFIHADLEKQRDQHNEFLIRKREHDLLQKRRASGEFGKASPQLTGESKRTFDSSIDDNHQLNAETAGLLDDKERFKVTEERSNYPIKQNEKEEIIRTKIEQEEVEMKLRMEEIQRKRKERQQMQQDLRKKEQEELEQKRKEQEELERKHREQQELERKHREQRELECKKREQEELERKRKEQEELEHKRREHEELERKRKEQEVLERKRKEQEELERKQKEQEELERKRKEQEEQERKLREEEALERKRREEEELERKRKEQEEQERKRIEELERKRIEQEELERKRIEQEELERKRIEQEELERKWREQEELERKRREQEELERKRREQEESERIRREQEELERKRREQQELERIRREQQELELKRREEEELKRKQREEEELKRKQREQEEFERKRMEQDELERERKEKEISEQKKRDQEAIERRLQEEEDTKRRRKELEEIEKRREAQRDQESSMTTQKTQIKLQGERSSRSIDKELDFVQTSPKDLDIDIFSSGNLDSNVVNTQVKSVRQLQREQELARIQKEEEETRQRRLLTQEALERKRKEVQQRMDAEEKKRLKLQELSGSSMEEKEATRKVSLEDIEKPYVPELDSVEIQKTKQRIQQLKKEREDIVRKHVRQMQQMLNPDQVPAGEDIQEADPSSEEISGGIESMIQQESSMASDITKSDDEQEEIVYDLTVLSAQHEIESRGPTLVSESTSSPLDSLEHPSPVSRPVYPPSTCSSEFEPLPPPIPPHNVDPASVMVSADVEQTPDVMTADEEQKLLSHNDGGILSDAEATEVHNLLERTVSPSLDKGISEEDTTDLSSSSKVITVEEVGVAKAPEEPSESSAPEEDVVEGFVYRAAEVFEEDGIHYLEDGHFWFEIPGLAEEDDDYMPQDVPVHQHTKIKFSTEPIQLFSTFSVNEYDRKNDDVDPVAASAEYELEKRVEKMDVFPVEINKGDSGLGLSIIGMGVGADEGVQKLGIFIKTITPGGPTDIDGKVKVNDQIIEVDGKSLVGVTQLFAATVLKNTSGTVRFLMGRDKDPDNSEVAALIRQSLQADRDREQERRIPSDRDGYDVQGGEGMFESLSSNSEDLSLSDGTRSYDPYTEREEGRIIDEPETIEIGDRTLFGNLTDSTFQNEEIPYLRHHLQEAQHTNEMYEEEINILRNRLTELEKEVADREEIARRVQETTVKVQDLEDKLRSRQAEITTYQGLLEESKGQQNVLEKKYAKAKKIIKEYQSRERDFLHREEYHITQLEEKDSYYNSLVKALKDRVIQLEGDLVKAQKTAGLPVQMRSSENSLLLSSPTSPESKEVPRKPESLNLYDPDLSDTEQGETAQSGGSKTSTVERKVPPKEELDVAIPPHSLLDNSASKAKGELASKGGLARRHLPSLKKTGSLSSSCSFENTLEDTQEDNSKPPIVTSESKTVESSSSSSITHQTSYTQSSHVTTHHEVFHTSETQGRAPPPYQPPPSAHSRPLSSQTSSQTFEQRSDIPYRNPPPVARVQPVNRVDIKGPYGTQQPDHQQRLADQLKAVLAERESSGEFRQASDESSSKKTAASLADDVRQAVLQADIALGKKPVISGPMHLTSPSGTHGDTLTQRILSPQKPLHPVGSVQSRVTSDPGPWTPRVSQSYVTSASPASGVVLLSQRPIDSSLPRVHKEPVSPTSINESFRESGDFSNSTVSDWGKEQVAHWLMTQGLESCIPKFVSCGVTGPRLINLDTRDLKNLGLSTDEKNKIKKKVKDLRLNMEKERKQAEKEKKERERLQKKAEKLAEKAEKKKK